MEITLIKKKDGLIDRKNGELISRLKVVAYARVSTDSEEQLNSYESQKKYYKEKIVSNPEWAFIDIYADEAISGTQDFKRTNFMRMIDDGLKGKYNMIITKSISRFARNTLDTLKYVRILKEKNIAILFEEENINTLEMSGELLLTILSSVAQQESETISNHVKLGLKMKSERGELVGFNNCYGFKYDNKTNTLSIVEEEADIVKMIFKDYIEGKGCTSIAKRLTQMKIKSPRGSDVWCDTTVRGILRNEKYKGDVIQGKTFTIDPISHKRVKNYGESDKYYMKDHHEGFIDSATYEKAQEILKERCGARATGRRLGNIGVKYPLSGMMKCGYCGNTYTRRAMYNKSDNIAIWNCWLSTKGSREQCPNSRMLRETTILNAFVDGYHILCNTNEENIESLFNNVTKYVNANNYQGKINQLKTQIYNIEQRKKRLVDVMLDGTIDKPTYTEKVEQFNKKIERLYKEINQYELLCEDDNKIENGISKIKEMIKNNNILEGFDEEVFKSLVDYIIIGGYDNGKITEYMIRFICKTKFNFTVRNNLTTELILKNNDISIQENDFITILDFYSMQKYNVFEKDENNKITKVEKDRVRVRFEIEKQ